ncbi:hypothetical protein FA13DRAFT_1733554 [Coprinellus micaceus]|uniref:Uncharacterized protein n=1 Tax=Coprinellus micaceus TaxID=71717 RepID=A0A4Y7T9Q1_COPMI|nr:hypothetical protein FA13DRAFT_1733554 [Coprinellus micaceus]
MPLRDPYLCPAALWLPSTPYSYVCVRIRRLPRQPSRVHLPLPTAFIAGKKCFAISMPLSKQFF